MRIYIYKPSKSYREMLGFRINLLAFHVDLSTVEVALISLHVLSFLFALIKNKYMTYKNLVSHTTKIRRFSTH